MEKTPETLTAAERAAALGIATAKPSVDQQLASSRAAGQAGLQAASDAPKSRLRPLPNVSGAALPKLTIQSSQNPGAAAISADGDYDGSVMALPTAETELYGHNTRLQPNPKYLEIKASIRAQGITNHLTMTRPPGATRYHPYGGGNTRLQIAKELLSEGDQRFATLTVTIKKWPGHAQVLAAHMGENDARGDTSFWEKASAVARFKAEFEKENGRSLTVASLAEVLRDHGLAYGPRLVKSFDFAVNHLAPVGFWLSAAVVIDELRPAWQTCMALGKALDVRDTLALLTQALQDVAGRLQAAHERFDLEAGDSAPQGALDCRELIREWHRAIATELDLPTERVLAMAAALDLNRGLLRDQLLATPNPTPPAPRVQPEPLPADPPAPQIPLPGMLSSVRVAGAGQVPEAERTSADVHQVSNKAAPAVATTPAAPWQAHSAPRSREDAQREVLKEVAAFGQLFQLQDCLCLVDGMPLGFLVDLPARADYVGDVRLDSQADIAMRVAGWRLLASVSQQVNPDHLDVMPPQSTWRQAMEGGLEGLRQALDQSLAGGFDEQGRPVAYLAEIGALFMYPRTRDSLIRLLGALRDMPPA